MDSSAGGSSELSESLEASDSPESSDSPKPPGSPKPSDSSQSSINRTEISENVKQSNQTALTQPSLNLDVQEALRKDGLGVKLDGRIYLPDDSPLHPRNWSSSRKLFESPLICALEVAQNMLSIAGLFLYKAAGAHIDLGEMSVIFCFTTVYFIGQSLGGLIFPPFAESFGARKGYCISAAMYAAMCLLIGLCPHVATMVVGELVTGLASTFPTAVAVGSIENMFDVSYRIWPLQTWAFSVVCGVAIGPAYTTYTKDFSSAYLIKGSQSW
jgi:hypothetical protein